MTTFGVLYWDIYNDGCMSKEAAIEYNRRVIERGGNIKDCYNLERRHFVVKRFDPILIEMYKDKSWNTDTNTQFGTCLELVEFDIKYRKYLRFYEYNGVTTIPYIAHDKYLVDMTKTILTNGSLSDSDKVTQINTLYSESVSGSASGSGV